MAKKKIVKVVDFNGQIPAPGGVLRLTFEEELFKKLPAEGEKLALAFKVGKKKKIKKVQFLGISEETYPNFDGYPPYTYFYLDFKFGGSQ
jgi:hypothetical protein